jgi:cation diffusion facilitator family transporter
MHSESVSQWRHSHEFLGEHHSRHERRTLLVVALTVVMMAAEIVGGTLYGSMALVADGWHMATHAAALGIAAFAYMFARKHGTNSRFTMGTGKFGDLAAFSSAIILGMIALYIAYESLFRLAEPVPIHFREAISIAVVGLAVNLVSAWLLFDEPDHHGPHDDDHGHASHHHRDHNLRAAYIHVLADAFTSVLAIGGLTAALYFGWLWIDPMVALVGAGVILSWAYGLMRSAGAVLLDTLPEGRLPGLIRERIEIGGDKLSDLHLWRVGPGHAAVILSVVSGAPQPPAVYKERLHGIAGLSHVTVEVQSCREFQRDL